LREYDIRGIVGQTLSAADARAIGRAYAVTLGAAGGRRVAVGYDGRLTSPELEAALVHGLAMEGADVVRIGRGPTPMLYYAAATIGVDGGVMVTGSHNPPTTTVSNWSSKASRFTERRSKSSAKRRGASGLRAAREESSKIVRSAKIMSRGWRTTITATGR